MSQEFKRNKELEVWVLQTMTSNPHAMKAFPRQFIESPLPLHTTTVPSPSLKYVALQSFLSRTLPIVEFTSEGSLSEKHSQTAFLFTHHSLGAAPLYLQECGCAWYIWVPARSGECVLCSAGLRQVQALDFQARDQMEPFDFRMEGFLPGCPAAGWVSPLPT